jgi:protoheme IX farnesyltransferase
LKRESLGTRRVVALSSSQHRAFDRSLLRLTRATAGSTLALVMLGVYERASDGVIPPSDWPVLGGRLVPQLGGILSAAFLHRALAGLVSVLVVWLAIETWTRNSPAFARVLTCLSLSLISLQVVTGSTIALGPAWAIAHAVAGWTTLGAIGLLWLTSETAAAGAALPMQAREEPASGAGVFALALAYLQLTKPRIIELLLVTTVPTMILAYGAVPPVGLLAATLLGGTLAAGAANSINCYLDRDIDAAMRRTRKRPLPARSIPPRHALAFGYVLAVVSFFFLSLTVNILSAALCMLAVAFYVFVYTGWLKRLTPQNIVWGGAAGAVPALVGWSAVTDRIGPAALLMFAIVFIWTPPHFWALSLHYEQDYRAAGVPMLPVVKGRRETLRQIWIYSVALVPVTLALGSVAHLGPVYLVLASILGGEFIRRARRIRDGRDAPLRFFHFSIAYLTLLSVTVSIAGLLRGAAI